jgi:restriction system protein
MTRDTTDRDPNDAWTYDPMNGDVRWQVRRFIDRVRFEPERGVALLRIGESDVTLATIPNCKKRWNPFAEVEGSGMGWGSLGEYMDGDGRMLYPPASHLVEDELRRSRFPTLFASVAVGTTQQIMPRGRDGGRDFLAFFKEPFGTILTIVECKHYARRHKVGVGLVRQLHSVLERDRANRAILATTSYFTQAAQNLALELKYRLSLRDHDDIVEWCRRLAFKRSR